MTLTQLVFFVLDNPAQWHTYGNDSETLQLIINACSEGFIQIDNEQRFKLEPKNRKLACHFLWSKGITIPVRQEPDNPIWDYYGYEKDQVIKAFHFEDIPSNI